MILQVVKEFWTINRHTLYELNLRNIIMSEMARILSSLSAEGSLLANG